MVTKLDPIVSEFDTQEEADAYDVWFRAKVQKSLDGPRPGIPHDQVMAELEAIADKARVRRASVDEATGLATLDPLVSEFATQEEADAYNAWFRAKVEARLRKPGRIISHDEVMARMDQVIERAVARRKADGR